MAFQQIIPRFRCGYADIRVSFNTAKNGTTCANIYFSVDLLDRLGWKSTCRVFVYVDDKHPSMWLIKKANDDEKDTFRLTRINESSPSKKKISKLSFKFSESSVIDGNKKIQVVNYEIKDNDILIKLF